LASALSLGNVSDAAGAALSALGALSFERMDETFESTTADETLPPAFGRDAVEPLPPARIQSAALLGGAGALAPGKARRVELSRPRLCDPPGGAPEGVAPGWLSVAGPSWKGRDIVRLVRLGGRALAAK